MQSEIVKFYMESETKAYVSFQVRKTLLLTQMSDNQKNSIQNEYHIPSKCASSEVFTIFQKYLNSKNINLYKQKLQDTELLIGTLRFTDFVGMNNFQQSFISQIVAPSINTANCVPFLQQTHKKLKNQENGSQCWYSLLNACITFLALHLSEVYLKSEQKIKGLHQKILNEILDRAIRNNNNDEEKIFELIIKSRKTESVHSLCQILRKSILNKKINPKIHAKLSWKLQDVANINEKKTKNFKFLEYEWLLQASRSQTNELQINLTYCGIEQKMEIGVFYIKLIWWTQGKQQQKKQQEMKINYLLMNKKYQLKVLTLTQNMQKQLGKSKIELSIFCCMDQIYTFTLNYITKNHQTLNLEQRQLTSDQLIVISRIFKERKEYSSSIRYLKYLVSFNQNYPLDLVSSFPLSELNAFQIDFIQKLNSQKKLTGSDVSSQYRYSSQISETPSNTSHSRRLEERPQSKGRLRKIFASSPNRSIEDVASIRIEDINRITNLKTYFYDKSHPLYYQI